MTTYSLFEYLLELNQEAAMELFRTRDYQLHNTPSLETQNKKTLLVFPEKGKELRISEQELRFVIVNLHGLFNHLKLDYAIEVPTDLKYSFSGKGSRSGSTDLSFYSGSTKVLNVEFKANVQPQKNFDKDIEKLFNENVHGAWCHLLLNEDSGTLRKIFEKLVNSCKKFGNPKKPLFFSFLILNKRTLITRKGLDSDVIGFLPSKIFTLTYSDYSKLPVGKHFIGDWQIDKF
jgi:hypothetical protein